MTIYELNDIDLFDYQLKNIKKDFIATQQNTIDRDVDFVELIEKLEHLNSKEIKEEVVAFEQKHLNNNQTESDIINYNNWLRGKIKGGTK
ncbi:MAG: hypothetical protein CVT95_11050 [Bacteroidetes bacterium HGW-Bacteroidetes-12]|nr:MAG: hypothetical protein CVT95_11050 [Bacteroidetes bacterium HGW-Bacteroidetes-12]